MHDEIVTMMNKLKTMTLSDLQRRYAEVFGEGTRCHHKDHLIKRIVWRFQAMREGGLSDRALARAGELANEADLRLRAPASPRSGKTPLKAATANGAGTRGAAESEMVVVESKLSPVGTCLTPQPKSTGTRVVLALDHVSSLTSPPPHPLIPGTMLRREFKGRTIVVRVLAQGFEHEGELYKSLTAVAEKVTGSHWNGHAFFGLNKNAARKSSTTP